MVKKMRELIEKIGKLTEANFDPEQEDLFNRLIVIAENDGDAYKKKDPRLAASNARKQYKKDAMRNLEHDLKVVIPVVEKYIKKRWSNI